MRPAFTVTFSVEEMEILGIALLQYVSRPIDDASACAADTLLDKLLDITEIPMTGLIR